MPAIQMAAGVALCFHLIPTASSRLLSEPTMPWSRCGIPLESSVCARTCARLCTHVAGSCSLQLQWDGLVMLPMRGRKSKKVNEEGSYRGWNCPSSTGPCEKSESSFKAF